MAIPGVFTDYTVPMSCRPALDPDVCYDALKARDTRFDGRFFVGVSSTGVYCRPVCRVRLPKRENCSFHASAAAAELAGFRPCLRCRPELAPGLAAIDAAGTLARSAALLIDQGMAPSGGLEQLANRVGIGSRHLRRIFQAEYGVTPIQYAQTQRLLMAKHLLTDTALPIGAIAHLAGFASVRRLNALIAERYRLTPGDIRRSAAATAQPNEAFRFTLPYRPPYDFAGLLEFLAARAIPGVESVEASHYRRVLAIAGDSATHVGWIEIGADLGHHHLRLSMAPALAPVAAQVLASTKRVFDTRAEPQSIAAALGPLALGAEGLRLPGSFDPFELAVRAVLGQQITVKAARTLALRFTQAFGTAVATPFPALNLRFPETTRVARLDREAIASLGIVGRRAEAILALARAVSERRLNLDASAPVEATVTALCALPGIGPWTAQYIAMRTQSWPDAWPPRDVALLNALGLPNTARGQREADLRAENWRPWRSYALLHAWRRQTPSRLESPTS